MIVSGAVGFVLVLIWIGAIAISSHNYLAEGADTKLARNLEMPLNAIFRSLRAFNLPHLPAYALTLSIPVFVFALITLPILRASKRKRLPRELENPEGS